ncbi:MAG TPA: response regulator [Candidatus Methylomirabilis sp.]|jgi:two-component system, NtrC family, response regulator AtoC
MRKVLVVDDEPQAVELLEEFLTAKGYAVVGASGGEEALRRLKEEQPHMMLLDIRMPVMDGLEVLRRAREIDREVGIVMVTAVNEESMGREALRMGAYDYITKPLDFDYLERVLWVKITMMTL